MPMRLAIDQEILHGSKISLLTLDPDYRTICLNFRGAKFYKVPFPYLNFVFRYKEVPGGVCYPGVYGQGFSVFFTKEPIVNKIPVFYSTPTEPDYGVVCTDHNWDNYVFPNKEVMFGTIINFWWGLQHFADLVRIKTVPFTIDKWKKMTLLEAINFDWLVSLYQGEGLKAESILHDTILKNLPIEKYKASRSLASVPDEDDE